MTLVHSRHATANLERQRQLRARHRPGEPLPIGGIRGGDRISPASRIWRRSSTTGCAAPTGTEVPWGEIAKGYEYAKGQFVVITDDDLAKAKVEATQAIDV